ncbi:MAG: hypothetical protein RDU25_00790 [Patescibacteria group bacterium]|nr:hypothetical protein [Patescibacteria group bacterium]
MNKVLIVCIALVAAGCRQQMSVRGGDATAVSGPGGSAYAQSGNTSFAGGQGQSVYAYSCSVQAVQTMFSSSVRCICNGIEVQPVYDNATSTWICRPPTTTPQYNYGYPR